MTKHGAYGKIKAEERCYIKGGWPTVNTLMRIPNRGEVEADVEKQDSRSSAVPGMSGGFAVHTDPKSVLAAGMAPERLTVC